MHYETCICQVQFDTLIRLRLHQRHCTLFHAAIYAEMALISQERYGYLRTITAQEWDAAREMIYPHSSSLMVWFGTWRALCAVYCEHTGAVYVVGNGGRKPRSYQEPTFAELPEPEEWQRHGLLEPGRYTNFDVPFENCLYFIVAVIGKRRARKLYEQNRR